MAYKTLSVTLNQLEEMEALLDVAAELSTIFECHLIGLYIIPGAAVYPAVGPYAAPEVIDILTKYFDERLKETRSKFEVMMRRFEVSFEWREVRGSEPEISPTASEVGRSGDLLVVSDVSPQNSRGIERDFVANVVMDVGSPVLILPQQQRTKFKVEQVICGYNGSKQSARAIRDALPLLKLASDVRLVWVNPPEDQGTTGIVPGTDMAEALARHGIKATVEPLTTSGEDVGRELLTRAQHLSADLIVMGGYGHSRLREYVLGGATRTMLSAVRIPLLMSH